MHASMMGIFWYGKAKFITKAGLYFLIKATTLSLISASTCSANAFTGYFFNRSTIASHLDLVLLATMMVLKT